LVEDNPADVELTSETLADAKLHHVMDVVHDGEAALEYLRRAAPRPDLVLLDLNLPRMDGREVLAAMKEDPDLRTIPVVVLTSSRAEADVLQSYRLRCNAFITKPVGLQEFSEIVHAIEDFWFTVVRLPSQSPGR